MWQSSLRVEVVLTVKEGVLMLVGEEVRLLELAGPFLQVVAHEYLQQPLEVVVAVEGVDC